MMKGYLTVFLSLSLSVLIGFVLLLTGNSIRNAAKIRLECISDIGMNSVLAEFSIALHERYDLLYVDASYLSRKPAVSNIEERLTFYMNQNLNMYSKDRPWGAVELREAAISKLMTAAQGNGSSMKSQAVKYIQESGVTGEETEIFNYLETVRSIDQEDAMQKWRALQEQIAGMELPLILNEKGQWEEVPLGNPADRIFSLAGSDVFYLLGMDAENAGAGQIQLNTYISGRTVENSMDLEKSSADDRLFLIYLFEKMGNYRNKKENSLLLYQLEYIAQGRTSDYENLKAVVERLVRWRFAINSSYILDNSDMYGAARELAESLYAVQLKEEFKEPVTLSILYACAYLEALSEVKGLLNGGKIELNKNNWHTGMDQVLTGGFSGEFSQNSGFDYEQYLACMVMLLAEDVRNLRSMDIMEMDIRYITGNPYFAMDWCVERFHARIYAQGAMGDEYILNRTYGFY